MPHDITDNVKNTENTATKSFASTGASGSGFMPCGGGIAKMIPVALSRDIKGYPSATFRGDINGVAS